VNRAEVKLCFVTIPSVRETPPGTQGGGRIIGLMGNRSRHGWYQLAIASLVFVATLALFAAPALAAKAATGEPLFYPCSSCHPVAADSAARKLPNGFKKHRIVLGVSGVS
jgi:hypothetical protein